MRGKFSNTNSKNENIQNFLAQWELESETVLSEKIQLGDREIYPLYEISTLCNKSGEIVSASAKPILFLILENETRYIILFDEKEMENHENIFDLFDMIPETENK